MTQKTETLPPGNGTAVSGATEWLPRLFRNTYTRAGQRFQLDNWSVKIQYCGHRHTFSLSAKTKLKAAVEAKTIHELIRSKGWDVAIREHSRRNKPATNIPLEPEGEDYWKARLLPRRYQFPPSAETPRDLAARIDDEAGRGYWFPLFTSHPETARVKAEQIRRMILENGWDTTCRSCSRELIVGFEWFDNPILWTYTTIHTLVGPSAPNAGATATTGDSNPILILETDAGIRGALEWCINQQPGFLSVPCDAEKFGKAFEQHRPLMVVLNRNLAERVGFDSPGRVAAIRRGVPAVTYSVVPEGDQLFVSTPGGAEGYLLKRVSPTRLLAPVVSQTGPPNLSVEDLLPRVKSYFKELLVLRSDREASGLARLTRREHEVLALLSKGCVDKEIAQALGISVWTVHGHIKNIFERLRVRTRTEAVVRYLNK